TTQLSQFQYNAYGKVTKMIDPTNRTTIMIYSNNLIDLLKVCQMVSPTSSNVLAQFTYNSQHLPLSVIDAAGQTNSFGYNTNGLLLAATNALGETATSITTPTVTSPTLSSESRRCSQPIPLLTIAMAGCARA